MPSYQQDWDRNTLLTTETVPMHRTEHKSLAPMPAYKAAYIEKSCWAKPKTTSGNRPEQRTHLIPKECPCQGALDIAGRMTNLALGRKSHSSLYTVAGSAIGSEWAWPILRFGLPWEISAACLKPGFPGDRPTALSSRSTALKAVFRDHWFSATDLWKHTAFFLTTLLRNPKEM